MSRTPSTLAELARLGFTELSAARDRLHELPHESVPLFAGAADPDQALRELEQLRDKDPETFDRLLADEQAAARLIRVLGASSGLAQFLMRHPEHAEVLFDAHGPRSQIEYETEFTAAAAEATGIAAQDALRVAYRRAVLSLAAWDLEQADPRDAVEPVAAALADLAGAALHVALQLARRDSRAAPEALAATSLAIIGMGKAGGRELNYLSDVDVIFVAERRDDAIDDTRMLSIATSLARSAIAIISEPSVEPPLWEVDANLRPEGKDGALVRTLESHLAYYERWAKIWEFQALLKARPLAGDADLGRRYVETLAPLVWASAGREGFVASVQGMRERVTEHVPSEQRDVQLKLGPGGLRDIEFTVQLLQLVHGQYDGGIRQGSTLSALAALAEGGYVGRAEAVEFSEDYRLLRLLEHRLQLAKLQRTHLMPTDAEALRVLARATGVFANADELIAAWERVKRAVRSLHLRLFYRPLLSAVAALPEEGAALSGEQAAARLAVIGFVDPVGALRHIAALTAGVSRRAAIQRTLLPVMLEWLSEGADPDHGLLAFRRISEDLGEAYWYLRMLRDSTAAAHRLAQVLSGSRYATRLLERTPDAAAWLENDSELRPRAAQSLLDEALATTARHESSGAAVNALRAARRREMLRVALASLLGVISTKEVGRAIADINTAFLQGALASARRGVDGIQFAVIAMGRFGGAELGFGSDADVMYVYRSEVSGSGDGADGPGSRRMAERLVRALVEASDDLRLPLDLDASLRPEGKNGPIVRSLDSYRAYYARWSLTWEAQALLRARGVAGDQELIDDFEALADEVRYPARLTEHEVREVKRVKARVEAERLPQAADPSRHLKLGRGSLSDVEWFVQLLQLQYGHGLPALRTTSTLDALSAALDARLVQHADADVLRDAWMIATRARSATTLWSGAASDILPIDWNELEGVARVMGYPPGHAAELEHDYLRATRLARRVFEREFYGE
ncbi:bifunctional [glutamine synthetase] adenylyltransferase/[glutamine synthetase]-adenylyl-L-tyrosine phosphorylase [Ruicaihuangia caeni]|uniref:Bifunctional glutamine synthetase adenylyltransferase/adenylyl-removing enzyme n=1 Tax=Ruicaihuangia caeni TaxID=3042517 RepID=A0AAW6T5N8_9MICO|nr:bifunctional [glutamine synthetase] adenylyltransferase/[glutamine synthetase]-adenylyl-L-tyrosine phosphorylase [Klugiella sp. YN-L-19]MDI2097991.1 bifunctional [glutamine synthetase] adenylyltransferase/[glutamine synthetase]-adenylyl-L-tyrosine phosphorylase [Klugiella sp. YN-L-19]